MLRKCTSQVLSCFDLIPLANQNNSPGQPKQSLRAAIAIHYNCHVQLVATRRGRMRVANLKFWSWSAIWRAAYRSEIYFFFKGGVEAGHAGCMQQPHNSKAPKNLKLLTAIRFSDRNFFYSLVFSAPPFSLNYASHLFSITCAVDRSSSKRTNQIVQSWQNKAEGLIN